MKPFKIRASQVGKIMTDAKVKGELSAGAKTYVKEWLISQLYEADREIRSKYLDKGNEMEVFAIRRYSEFAEKNEEHYENDYATGTPDLVMRDKIADTKCSYDAFTFPLFETECPNKDYWWQLQTYMWLTGRKVADLAYCLENTPPTWEGGEWVMYDYLPPHLRLKVFTIEYDPTIEQRIMERVLMCRRYAESLLAEIAQPIE